MVNVLYIGGAGRSGSTMLDQLLPSHGPFHSLGELKYIYSAGVRRGQVCGCGENLTECKFWSSIFGRMVERYGFELDAHIISFKYVFDRKRLLQVFFPAFRTRRFRIELAGLMEDIQRLYREIQSELGGEAVLVDSSKDPAYLSVLSEIGGFEIKVLHAIRDPRGVCYSRMNPKIKTSLTGVEYMNRQGVVESVAKWLAANLLTSYVARRQKIRKTLLSYEAVCSDHTILPVALLELGMPCGPRGDLQNNVNHTCIGNPGRAIRGSSVRVMDADERWRTGLSYHQKLLIKSVLFPFFVIYRVGRRND